MSDLGCLENLQKEFSISRFNDFDHEKDNIYELSCIVNYNRRDNAFELIIKEESKWYGLADGDEVAVDDKEFLSLIPLIIQNPIMLIYQTKREYQKSKFEYKDKEDEVMVYEDKNVQKQYEDDTKYAQELQKKLDDEEAEKQKDKSNKKRKPDDIDELLKSETKNKSSVKQEFKSDWQCKHWTLDNKLPDYRWTAWDKLDTEAMDNYWILKAILSRIKNIWINYVNLN